MWSCRIRISGIAVQEGVRKARADHGFSRWRCGLCSCVCAVTIAFKTLQRSFAAPALLTSAVSSVDPSTYSGAEQDDKQPSSSSQQSDDRHPSGRDQRVPPPPRSSNQLEKSRALGSEGVEVWRSAAATWLASLRHQPVEQALTGALVLVRASFRA